MPVRFQRTGCLWSIVVSVLLTVLLNLLIYACSGGYR
jgi:hypothetical protein